MVRVLSNVDTWPFVWDNQKVNMNAAKVKKETDVVNQFNPFHDREEPGPLFGLVDKYGTLF